MKFNWYILLICIPLNCYCQFNGNDFQLNITDTLIVHDLCNDAIRIHLELKKINKFSTVNSFYRFNREVHPNTFMNDTSQLSSYHKASTGLFFYITDVNLKVVPAKPSNHINYKLATDEINRSQTIEYVDDKNLKLKRKKIPLKDFNEFKLGKIGIDSVNTSSNMIVYPILSGNYSLEKGEYYIWLFYSFNGTDEKQSHQSGIYDIENLTRDKIFIGFLQSNPVKLIVKK